MQPVQVTVQGAVAVEVKGSVSVQEVVTVTQAVQVTVPAAVAVEVKGLGSGLELLQFRCRFGSVQEYVTVTQPVRGMCRLLLL